MLKPIMLFHKFVKQQSPLNPALRDFSPGPKNFYPSICETIFELYQVLDESSSYLVRPPLL